MDEKAGVHNEGDSSRREFLKGMAATVGGFALAGSAGRMLHSTIAGAHGVAAAAPLPVGARSVAAKGWADQIGLELFTVRDLTAKDYIGTLEKIARIGYKEIEPAGGYANLSPKQFRAELDRLGLRMPSTHSGITAGPQADVEKQLADFQVMGIEYASFGDAPPAGGQRRMPPRGAAPAVRPTPGEQRKRMQQFISRMAQPRTSDDVKQEAARYNEFGRIAKRFGIKLLIHNHTVEFIPCKDSGQLPYTILLAETDPELVVFQLDIGWARVAGQDPLQLFNQHPGRFPLWHVKDMDCLEALPPVPDQGGRMAAARIVPVGNGEIDYAEIFKHADVAGLKHFCIEQDSAGDWGDAIAAARVSYEQLRGMLAGQA